MLSRMIYAARVLLLIVLVSVVQAFTGRAPMTMALKDYKEE